jgi:hypothetical protein
MPEPGVHQVDPRITVSILVGGVIAFFAIRAACRKSPDFQRRFRVVASWVMASVGLLLLPPIVLGLIASSMKGDVQAIVSLTIGMCVFSVICWAKYSAARRPASTVTKSLPILPKPTIRSVPLNRALRYLVAFVAVSVAVAVTLSLASLETKNHPLPANKTPEERIMVLEWLVVFMSTMSLTGELLYRLMGATSEIRELKPVPGEYVPILRLIAGVFLVSIPLLRLPPNSSNTIAMRMTLTVGTIMIAHAIYSLIRLNRKGEYS